MKAAEAATNDQADALRRRAAEARLRDIRMVHGAGMGHVGGEFSAMDILVTLYFGGVLRYDPANPNAPERDRFVLSKGHSAAALYTTLAMAGYFDVAELDTWLAPLSRLNGHPDRNKVPGVETNTGPLGHGFPVAVGIALSAARLDGSERRTFVLTGDGELQEGSMWEAAMAAGHFGLDRLVCIVDRNRLQQGDRTETTMGLDPLPAKFAPSAGPCARSTATIIAALLDTFARTPLRGRQAQLRHRQHHQGPRRLVHRGPQGAGTTACPPTRSTRGPWRSWKAAGRERTDRGARRTGRPLRLPRRLR